MSTPPSIQDYSRHAGTPFYAYTTEQMIAIVRTWAEHAWPITLPEAFALRDQYGWIPAPGDGTLFSTQVSNGELDGAITEDVRNDDLVGSVDVRMTTRAPIELKSSQISTITQSIYTNYRSALSALYGTPEDDTDSTGPYSTWTLRSNASITLSCVSTFVEVEICSPADTKNKELWRYYENKYGPDIP
jgi:hypothetical protein